MNKIPSGPKVRVSSKIRMKPEDSPLMELLKERCNARDPEGSSAMEKLNISINDKPPSIPNDLRVIKKETKPIQYEPKPKPKSKPMGFATKAIELELEPAINDSNDKEKDGELEVVYHDGRELSKYQLKIRRHIHRINKRTKRPHFVCPSVAGSGKSWSLKMCVREIVRLYPKDKVLVLQFNTHIADATRAALGPIGNVEVKTNHGAGVAVLNLNGYRCRVEKSKMFAICKSVVEKNYGAISGANDESGMELEAEEVSVNGKGGKKKETKSRKIMAWTVSLTEITEMCQQTLTDPSSLPALKAMIERQEMNIRSMILLNYVNQCIDIGIEQFRKLRIISFTEMLYLPVVLDMRFPKYDWVLCDESQDFNAAQMEIVFNHLADTGRIGAFGDERQCNPTGTMVAMHNGLEKPIEEIQVGDSVASWVSSESRFAYGQVQQIASSHTEQKLYTVKWNDKSVECTYNHKFVVKWSEAVLENRTERFIVYMMRKGERFRIGKTRFFVKCNGSSREFGLRARFLREQADEAWILHLCDNETDALVKEQIASYKYGLPMMMFLPVESKHKMHFNQDNIDTLFDSCGDLRVKAEKLLDDYELKMDCPFIGMNDKFKKHGGAINSFHVYACNIISGAMSLPGYDRVRNSFNTIMYQAKRIWQPIESCKLNKEEYRGIVHSLKIDRGTYISNGIPTHNSIMMWAGSMPDSMEKYIKRSNARNMPLSVCYRCPSSVLDLARLIVPYVENRDNCPEGLVETIKFWKIKDVAKAGDYILCRLTAPLVSMCIEFIKSNIRAKVKGRDIGTKLKSLYEDVVDSAKGKVNTVSDFLGYLKDYAQAERISMAAKKTSQAKIIQMEDSFAALKAIGEYLSGKRKGEYHGKIKEQIGWMFDEAVPEDFITLCTVHRAKGLEANNVFIIDFHRIPFKPGQGQKEVSYSKESLTQEMNLMYVALTRPIEKLYICGQNMESMDDVRAHIKNWVQIKNELENGGEYKFDGNVSSPSPETSVNGNSNERLVDINRNPNPKAFHKIEPNTKQDIYPDFDHPDQEAIAF